MKIEKLIATTQEQEIEIEEVTLLSEEEYRAAKNEIPRVHWWWWLRSPGGTQYDAASVYGDGSLRSSSVSGDYGSVRPALRLRNPESSNLKLNDKFFMAGYAWTVIAEGLALCDQLVGDYAFREDWRAPDANNFEASDVKKWLTEWAINNGIK